MNSAPVVQQGIFADTIRRLRTSEQLTQRDLARLAGVYQDDIERIEHGIPLQLEIKLKILRVLYNKRHPH